MNFFAGNFSAKNNTLVNCLQNSTSFFISPKNIIKLKSLAAQLPI